jgi:uncharacterized protein (DUF1330 family)
VSAYVIFQAEVFDPVQYEQYKSRAEQTVVAAGGRYIVRGGDVVTLEGEAPVGRTVVLEFPTMHAALDWYRSDDYAEARRLRDDAARARVFIVDGIDA